MKDYTPIRRFYAWVGFFSLLFYAALGIASLFPARIDYERPYEVIDAIITAYTSSPDETDDTPFENASGGVPQTGSIACPNRLAFSTLVSIDGRFYRCDDRMNARFRDSHHFDIWMPSKAQAFEFGRRSVKVIILDI